MRLRMVSDFKLDISRRLDRVPRGPCGVLGQVDGGVEVGNGSSFRQPDDLLEGVNHPARGIVEAAEHAAIPAS